MKVFNTRIPEKLCFRYKFAFRITTHLSPSSEHLPKKVNSKMNTDTTPFLQSPSSVPSSDNQKADFQVLTTVFYYCFTIIVMPVLTFFSCKYILFDGVLGVDSVSSNVYSAIAAIIVVHIALAMFIIRAYTDSSPVKPLKFDEKLD